MSLVVQELEAVSFPDADVARRFDALVGLDAVKRELLTALSVAVRPKKLEEWSRRHPGADAAVKLVLSRQPLFILAGDVGTGKSELGETVGDALARQERCEVLLYRLSLSARGSGLVGEMTQRLTGAFGQLIEQGRSWTKSATTGILFIDEADAIAQSRETDQMHHEDRAGVNALIRAIDDLGRARVPVAVIMATNRLEALDPAIRRRAANVWEFQRPSEAQRADLLQRLLPTLADDAARFKALVTATGPRNLDAYGFSYSDIAQRLVPSAVLAAYRDAQPVTPERVLAIANDLSPTPPFTAMR